LDNLSGGESVWVKRAIYDTFAVVRKRNTNFCFKTAFQDETDGALDAESKIRYAGMLESVHFENKMKHTIIITHSDSVKASIPQQINMDEFEETRF
jgi:DNA repair exonuclease SbcCD ATPase subunit